MGHHRFKIAYELRSDVRAPLVEKGASPFAPAVQMQTVVVDSVSQILRFQIVTLHLPDEV